MVEEEETAPYIHMALSSNPSFSRAGRADVKTVWEPYRSCTDTLPLDYDRCVKEKNSKKKKKWTEQCSATHPSRTTISHPQIPDIILIYFLDNFLIHLL